MADVGLRFLIFKGLVPEAVGGRASSGGWQLGNQGSLLRCPLHQWDSPSQTLWWKGPGLERAQGYLLGRHGISRVTALPAGTGVLFSCDAGVLRCLSGLLWDLKSWSERTIFIQNRPATSSPWHSEPAASSWSCASGLGQCHWPPMSQTSNVTIQCLWGPRCRRNPSKHGMSQQVSTALAWSHVRKEISRLSITWWARTFWQIFQDTCVLFFFLFLFLFFFFLLRNCPPSSSEMLIKERLLTWSGFRSHWSHQEWGGNKSWTGRAHSQNRTQFLKLSHHRSAGF